MIMIMIRWLIVSQLLLVAILSQCHASTIPKYIDVCHRNESNVSQCILDSIEKLRPKFVKGIPELNIPAIEPLYIQKISWRSGPDQALFYAKASNVTVWGPSNFKILSLKADLDNNIFTYKILLNNLRFEGLYEVNLRILLLSVRGKGPFNGSFTNYKSHVIMKGHKVSKNGTEYLKFQKLKVKLELGDAKIQLQNLFNGDYILGNETNRILNENSNEFLKEFQPILEDAIADLFTSLANKVTTHFAYKDLFPY